MVPREKKLQRQRLSMQKRLGNFHYFRRAAMLLWREMIVRAEIEEVGWGSQFLPVFSVS